MSRIKLFISSVQSEFAEERHKSMPTNPLIADPMYWCGYIEKLGTGTEDILKKCSEYGLKRPDFQQDEDFKVTFWRNEYEIVANGETVTAEVVPQETPQEVPQEIMGKHTKNILSYLCDYRSIKEISEHIEVGDRKYIKEHYLNPLIERGYVVMLFPDVPRHRNQRYKTTERGKFFLETIKNK